MLLSLFVSSWEKEKAAAVSPVIAVTEDREGDETWEQSQKDTPTEFYLLCLLIN